jgi:D-alanyl-D-alanine carboxypeptidase
MLLLHRAKLVNLDGRVLDYLDLPIDARITVRHLVMNMCGLGEMTFAMLPGRFDPRVKYHPRDLVALALPQGQLFAPGSQFDYCNTGWTVAALVIEAVTGKPYGDVIRERILQPLGLVNSFFGGNAPKDRMMRGYLTSPATAGPVDMADCSSWAFGAGDGVSDVDDMLDLFGSLCDSDSPIGVSLSNLTERTGKPCATPYFPLSLGTQYGLGVERRAWAGSEVWGHPGSTYAYLSGTWMDAVRGVTVTTCVTRALTLPLSPDAELRYPRAQLFAMALNTAYALADERGS